MSRAVEVVVSQRQRGLLEKLVRNRADTSYRLIERCRIVLMSADGVANVEQGRRLNADQQLARRWRRRWLEAHERLARAEEKGASEKHLHKLLVEVLSDRPRGGVIPTFSAEQLTKIIIEGPLDCPETLIPYTFPTSFGHAAHSQSHILTRLGGVGRK